MVNIWLHIAEDAPRQADSFLDLLQEKMLPLVAMPEMGIAQDDLQAGLRTLIFRNYLIFYINAPDKLIIVRVLHSSRDVHAVFEA